MAAVSRFSATRRCRAASILHSPDEWHSRVVTRTQHRALGRKVSDEFTVPLCRGHHREVHRSGNEAAWWTNAGVDPTVTARALWLETHPLPTSVNQMDSEGASSTSAVGADQEDAKRQLQVDTQ